MLIVVNHIFFTILCLQNVGLFILVLLSAKQKTSSMPSKLKPSLLIFSLILCGFFLQAQTSFKLKYNNSAVYAGIEVGSKGVKMSVIEIGKNAQSRGAFNVLKDSSVNTDFISFDSPSFAATLDGMSGLYTTLVKRYRIDPKSVYTVVSSGVKQQAEKEQKTDWITNLVDSFKTKINEPDREVDVVGALEEARLSHLGIVPEARRYNTFLIDIGSGNIKGGYFPNGNTKDFKLFNVNWGTKSTANVTDKRCGEDKSLSNFYKQLYRVLAEAENSEIIYAVNESGSYPKSDNVAFSGGIAWSVATLMFPELIDNAVVSVTFDQVQKFYDRLYTNFDSVTEPLLIKNILDKSADKTAISKEVKRVHQVFDQKSLLAGTGLLLKVMRQFQSLYEGKQFYLVKNGQVGWISAYVDQTIRK
jgi:Mor family transcriptional regulator